MTGRQDENAFVTIAEFADLAQADMLRARLEAEGISAYLHGEEAAALFARAPLPSLSVRVQVERHDEQAAEEILAQVMDMDPVEYKTREDEVYFGIDEDTIENVQSTDAGDLSGLLFFLKALLLGLLLCAAFYYL